jgi:hypothetical protein
LRRVTAGVYRRAVSRRLAARPSPDAAPRPSPAARRVPGVLALQRAAGNRAVAQLLRQPTTTLLTPTGARRAAAQMNKRYDENSIRGLQSLMRRTPGTVFTPADAEALAELQHADGLHATGVADTETLDALLSHLGPGGAVRSLMIHMVVDNAGVDVSRASEIVFDPALAMASDVRFLPGGVPEIHLGNAAFASSAAMLREIRTQLAAAPPTPTLAGAGPPLADAKGAIAANRAKLRDPRAIRIVQGTVGTKPTGSWDEDTVRHIGSHQLGIGHAQDGKLDDETMEALVENLVVHGEHDAAIALIIAFYKLDRRHAFDVRYVPAALASKPTARAQTLSTAPPGTGVAGVVELYPLAFRQPFAGLVGTIAHELGHIEQNLDGISSEHVREFLSHGIQVEAKGLPAQEIESVDEIDRIYHSKPPVRAGLIDAVTHMLEHWQRMTTDEKEENHARYIELRDLVLDRIDIEAMPDQKQKLGPVIRLLKTADAGVP